jgi:hypothetical protein
MRKLPDTSHAAKASFTDPMKKTHHAKIIKALEVLGKGNYEIIGNYIGMKNINQIARRLKEMMPKTEDNPNGLDLIFKPGTKSKTSSGREAYDYCLTNNMPKIEKESKKVICEPIGDATSHDRQISLF